MSIEKILTTIGALLALIAGVFLKGRSDGKKDIKREYDTVVAKQQAEAAKQVKELKNEASKKTDDSVTDELKSRWVRK